jgi:hypothetical protein
MNADRELALATIDNNNNNKQHLVIILIKHLHQIDTYPRRDTVPAV